MCRSFRPRRRNGYPAVAPPEGCSATSCRLRTPVTQSSKRSAGRPNPDRTEGNAGAPGVAVETSRRTTIRSIVDQRLFVRIASSGWSCINPVFARTTVRRSSPTDQTTPKRGAQFPLSTLKSREAVNGASGKPLGHIVHHRMPRKESSHLAIASSRPGRRDHRGWRCSRDMSRRMLREGRIPEPVRAIHSGEIAINRRERVRLRRGTRSRVGHVLCVEPKLYARDRHECASGCSQPARRPG